MRAHFKKHIAKKRHNKSSCGGDADRATAGLGDSEQRQQGTQWLPVCRAVRH